VAVCFPSIPKKESKAATRAFMSRLSSLRPWLEVATSYSGKLIAKISRVKHPLRTPVEAAFQTPCFRNSE
jgi:hypothetical protein